MWISLSWRAVFFILSGVYICSKYLPCVLSSKSSLLLRVLLFSFTSFTLTIFPGGSLKSKAPDNFLHMRAQKLSYICSSSTLTSHSQTDSICSTRRAVTDYREQGTQDATSQPVCTPCTHALGLKSRRLDSVSTATTWRAPPIQLFWDQFALSWWSGHSLSNIHPPYTRSALLHCSHGNTFLFQPGDRKGIIQFLSLLVTFRALYMLSCPVPVESYMGKAFKYPNPVLTDLSNQ